MRLYSVNSQFYYDAPLDLTAHINSTDDSYFWINKDDTRIELTWTHQFTATGSFINHYEHVVSDWIVGYDIGVIEVRVSTSRLCKRSQKEVLVSGRCCFFGLLASSP